MRDSSEQELLKERLAEVQERINYAAEASGRDPDEIELVVVTKGKSAEVVKGLVDLGIKKIGESYLKEALFKQELLQNYEIEWHMIGTIQSGKAKQIIYNFEKIHSVDRIELAHELQKWAQQLGRKMPIYLELNVSGEATKQGWTLITDSDHEIFLKNLDQIFNMNALEVQGLMTMAPYSENPETARWYFRKLREASNFLQFRYPERKITGLSMGMSGDFEVAIQEGATILRIGSAIVGERQG
jgi:pyridoxal phosphate enzyme (YggS family)